MPTLTIRFQHGFTLVELMIVVTIMGVLISIALPALQDYIVRIKLTEGIILSAPAKAAISEIATGSDLNIVATTFNNQNNNTGANSKYVEDIQINPITGAISIRFNHNTVGLAVNQRSLSLTPFIVSAPGVFLPLNIGLTTGALGPIDWACATETSDTSVSRGLPSTAIGASGVKARFAPSECK